MSFYRRPEAASFSTGKFLLFMAASQVLSTFIIWLGRTFLSDQVRLSLSDVILGSIPGLLGTSYRWVWRMKKAPYKLFVWMIKLFFHLYISGLALLATIHSWNKILANSRFVNGITIAAYISAWVLPWLFPPLSKRLCDKQWGIGLYALVFSGSAGIIGASIGLHADRGFDFIFSGILMGAIAVGWAQYAGYEIWENRPWTLKLNEQ